MTARRDRVARIARVATETRDRARAQLLEADRLVGTVDRRRTAALERAASLAGEDVPLALRGHLAGAGARHLVALADEKAELIGEVDLRRDELDEAVTRLRSLERLIERLDEADALRRRRQAAAELQDLVAVRAARGVT